MKVSIEAIQYAYGVAKRYYAGSLSFTDAYTNISEHTGMAVNSAKDYINNLKYMLEGRCYARTLNTYATEYYLTQIRKDYGEQAFQAAISATQQHVAYYNSLGYAKRRSIEKLLKELTK
jgi:hypothetical protein